MSTLVMLLAVVASCSSDMLGEIVTDGGGNGTGSESEAGISAVMHAKEMTQIGTRSALNFDLEGKQMLFSWDRDDKLTVFAEDNYQAQQIYYIVPKDAYGQTAFFSSADFKLTMDKRYYSLNKKEHDHAGGEGTKIPDQRNITLDFSGQVQTANASCAHLGQYDFMATTAICKQDNLLHFDFQHLGATMRMIVIQKKGDAAFPDCTFNSLELYSSDNSYRQPLRRLSLVDGLKPDGSFEPRIAEPDDAGNDRLSISLDKGSGVGISPSEDFNDGSGTNTYKDLVVYMEVPPADLTGKKLGLILRGKNSSNEDVTYYSVHDGFDIAVGKVHNIYFIANPTTDYTVTLKVDHNWMHGKTVTRTTGDPGFDKDFDLPKYLYLFFCADGKVKWVKEYTNEGAGLEASRWTTTNNISTFDTPTTLSTTDDIVDKNTLRVYAIASQTPITHGIAAATNSSDDTPAHQEAAVKALKYDYVDQDKIRGLYSTPWADNATFVGNLKDPVQDIFVYHTAAKVDLKWNNDTETALTGNISVNSFQSQNLSYFMPTQNGTASGVNGVADFTSGSTQTVSTAINGGTCWNGRQVYYLPQFANNQYNITIGTGHTYNPFTFTGTNTTGGFTSWLRGEITQ